jgi:hypothetical protein
MAGNVRGGAARNGQFVIGEPKASISALDRFRPQLGVLHVPPG